MLNVLVYYQTTEANAYCATWMQRSTTGAWTEATLGGTAKDALGFVYQSDVYLDSDNTPYVYGVSGGLSTGAFFIASFDSGSNSWDVGDYYWLLSAFSPALSTQAAFRMAAGSAGNQFTVLWVDTPPGEVDTFIYHQGASLGHKQIQWDSSGPGNFNPNLGTLTVDGLFGLPGDYGQDSVLILDGSGALHLVQGYSGSSPTATTLTGTDATQPAGTVGVAVGVDSTGVLTVFAIESGEDNNLWYVQQQSPSEPLDPTSWVNLGGKLFAVGCRSSMVAGPELFCAETGAQGPTVYHMDRSLSNPVWSTRKVAAPIAMSGDPSRIASYTMELTTLDTYGNIVPSTWLSVTADQAATLIWNLVAYHVGPNTPIQVQTDGSGQASVQLQCDSLKPPVVTYTASNGNSAVSRWCQGDVVEVKSEEQALPPLANSVAPTLQNVNGQTLISQKLFNTQGYNSQSDAQTAANNTALAINATGQWMSGNPNDPAGSGLLNTKGINTPHWQIDFTHSEGPRFRELTVEEARAIVRRSRDGSTPPLLGGSLGSVFGDVAHFFKKEWQKLHTFSSSLENDVLTITLEAEEGTQSFVISTVKEAGAGLETVFAQISQIADDIYGAIADVIAWLKMLFDWEDILNTQKAINACVNQTIANIKMTVGNNDAQQAVNKWIGELKSQIGGAFKQLESVFEPGTSYNTYANSAAQTSLATFLKTSGTSDSDNILAAVPVKNAQQQHASKCNYVYSKTKSHYASSGSSQSVILGVSSSNGVQPIIDAIMNNIYGSDFNSGVAKIYTQLQTLGSNPGAIFDLIIVDFLNAAQDAINVVIDGLEAVVDAIIQVATDTTVGVFDAIDSILNTKIPIPVVAWLWTNVIDKGSH